MTPDTLNHVRTGPPRRRHGPAAALGRAGPDVLGPADRGVVAGVRRGRGRPPRPRPLGRPAAGVDVRGGGGGAGRRRRRAGHRAGPRGRRVVRQHGRAVARRDGPGPGPVADADRGGGDVRRPGPGCPAGPRGGSRRRRGWRRPWAASPIGCRPRRGTGGRTWSNGSRKRCWLDDAAAYAAIWPRVAELDLLDRLAGVRCPTLAVVCEADASTPPPAAAAIVGRIAGARRVVLPGGAHLAHLEAPAAVNAVLREFLATVDQSRPEGTGARGAV